MIDVDFYYKQKFDWKLIVVVVVNYQLRIYLFSSEQASYFVPIEIGIGHCIAGYVAWAKETVRINNITTVKIKKFDF
jgi:hypothetical protein